jgi:hypothetical protein
MRPDRPGRFVRRWYYCQRVCGMARGLLRQAGKFSSSGPGDSRIKIDAPCPLLSSRTEILSQCGDYRLQVPHSLTTKLAPSTICLA